MASRPSPRRRTSELPCGWAPADDALYRGYHDTEWGVPERDSRALWEKLQLDGHQAGLAWITILRKRETMREEFDGFEPERVARWNERRIAKAMRNPGIIRSDQKIRATVRNAQLFCDMHEQGLDFAEHLWSFVGGKPIVTRLKRWRDAPTRTEVSERLAKDLKRRGFSFCGPTIVYAFMQAVGMVNDHETRCPRFEAVAKARRPRASR